MGLWEWVERVERAIGTNTFTRWERVRSLRALRTRPFEHSTHRDGNEGRAKPIRSLRWSHQKDGAAVSYLLTTMWKRHQETT
jgi:hypothetical protein